MRHDTNRFIVAQQKKATLGYIQSMVLTTLAFATIYQSALCVFPEPDPGSQQTTTNTISPSPRYSRDICNPLCLQISLINALVSKKDNIALDYLQQLIPYFQPVALTGHNKKESLADWISLLNLAVENELPQSSNAFLDWLGNSIDDEAYNSSSGVKNIYHQKKTPLFWAIMHDKITLSQFLIAAGATIQTADLDHAIAQKNEKLVQMLVARGADYPEPHDWCNYLLLLLCHDRHEASFKHRKSVIQQVLEGDNKIPRDLSRLICLFAAVPERQMPPKEKYCGLRHNPYIDWALSILQGRSDLYTCTATAIKPAHHTIQCLRRNK